MFNELIKELEEVKKKLEEKLVSKDKDHEAEFFREFSENYNISGANGLSKLKTTDFMIASICTNYKDLDFNYVYDNISDMSEFLNTANPEELNNCFETISGLLDIYENYNEFQETKDLIFSTFGDNPIVPLILKNYDSILKVVLNIPDNSEAVKTLALTTSLKNMQSEKAELNEFLCEMAEATGGKVKDKYVNRHFTKYTNEAYNLKNILEDMKKIEEYTNQIVHENKVEKKALKKELKLYDEVISFMRLSEGREEIYNLPDALLKIKDEEVKKKILIKIYENNNKKYLKQQEEYNKISKNSYTQYQLLFKKYGLDINSYTIDQNLDIATVTDTLEKLSKIELDKDAILDVLNGSSISSINSIYDYLSKGYISQEFVKNNIDIFNTSYDDLINNIAYFLDNNISVSLIQKCENNLNKDSDLVKRNIDSLEEYDLLKYLKKTTNNIFVSEENLTKRIDGLLELGFESKLKEGLDLLNYDLDSIKKIKLCIELGVNINEIDSMLVNGLSNIPNDSLSDYLYSAVEYNKPVSDLVKSKDEFLDSLSEYEDGKRLYNIDGVLISKNKVKRAFSKIDTNQVSTSTVYDIITANTILNDSECERIVSAISNKKDLIKK